MKINLTGALRVIARSAHLVHRLAALRFLPNPYNHPHVTHIDGDKASNTVQNLEGVGRGRNIEHSLETGLRAGFMTRIEKEALLERVLLGGEEITAVATAIRRRPDVLNKMLRQQAIRSGRAEEWTEVMKQTRKDVAIRNLQKVKRGYSSRTQR